MLKDTNKTKRTKTNFDQTTDSLIEKYYTISIRFKIRISQLIAKILLKQQSLIQIRHCLTGHIQIWHNFLLSKNIKVLSKFLWRKWTQTMKMKENQPFFHGRYSNLTSKCWNLTSGHKILKYFNDFYSWHLSNPLQKWAQTSKVK